MLNADQICTTLLLSAKSGNVVGVIHFRVRLLVYCALSLFVCKTRVALGMFRTTDRQPADLANEEEESSDSEVDDVRMDGVLMTDEEPNPDYDLDDEQRPRVSRVSHGAFDLALALAFRTQIQGKVYIWTNTLIRFQRSIIRMLPLD